MPTPRVSKKMVTTGPMNIGEAANASGLSAKQIRYYEAVGVIRPATRRGSGYRHYAIADVHRLRFVRCSRNLGLSLATIRELLNLWGNRRNSGAAVRAATLEHVATLERRLGDIYAMIDTLREFSKTGNMAAEVMGRAWATQKVLRPSPNASRNKRR